MKSIFLAVTLFAGVLGIGRAAAPASPAPPTSSTTEAMVSTPATLELDDSEAAICPFQWFCDGDARWYGSRSQCLSSCSGTCEPDYNCSGGCVCP